MPSPLGHSLAGLATAWSADIASASTSRGRSAPLALGHGLTGLSVLLAVIPDIDLLFHAHRSFTHSVSAVALVIIISAVVTGWVTGRSPWRAALTCGSAYGTHLLLDWLAADTYFPYGIQMFWPFSRAWFISGLDVFPQTERQRLLSARTIQVNLMAMAWEAVILLPIVAAVWLVRVKTAARLASKVAGRNHSA